VAGQNESNRCTVLVTSCDRYRDIEAPFLALWRRHWPDCPFELVAVRESGGDDGGTAADGFDRVVATGPGLSWSEMLAFALERISTPYVLMLMNDYLLDSRVDTARQLELLSRAEAADALNLRMNPNPPRAVKNSAYAVSCQAGYWNREFLLGLARRTKSAWEFERYGSYMFDESDPRPIMVTERKEFPFVDALHKGYWEPEGVALLEREGIGYDFSRRGLPPFWPRLKSNLKKAVFAVFPWELVVRVQNVFNLGMK